MCAFEDGHHTWPWTIDLMNPSRPAMGDLCEPLLLTVCVGFIFVTHLTCYICIYIYIYIFESAYDDIYIYNI